MQGHTPKSVSFIVSFSIMPLTEDTIEDTQWRSISIKTRFTGRQSLAIRNTSSTTAVGFIWSSEKNGTKIWKFIFTFEGKRKKLSFGVYPDTTLENARRKAEEARNNLADVIDPSEIRKQSRAEIAQVAEKNQTRLEAGLPIVNSFEYITRQWLESSAHTVRDITHQKKIRRFELYVFPEIGQKPIWEVKSPEVFAVNRLLIIKKQLETAHRVRADISAVYAYAIAHGFADYDPAQAVGAQIPAQKVKHNAALTEPKEGGQLLREIAHYQGTFVVQSALKLSPYLFQRPGEIRQMEWKDVDLATKEWRYFFLNPCSR